MIDRLLWVKKISHEVFLKSDERIISSGSFFRQKLHFMRHQLFKPANFLKHLVRYYCVMESEAGEADMEERVIPAGNIQLMFHYKKTFTSRFQDGRSTRQPQTILGGMSNSFFDASTNGETGVIFVSFFPAGACHFFPFPLIEIENQNIDLSCIYGSEIRRVEYLLQEKKSAAERIEVVEQFLISRYTFIPDGNLRLIHAAVELVYRSGGQISTVELAETLSVTNRTLERKFAEFIGFTPKRFAGLIRFQHILSDIGDCNSLTQCAYRHGYFDQAHFIKDFKAFSGYTPGEFVEKLGSCASEKPSFSAP